MTLTPAQRERLNANLPPDRVRQREGGGKNRDGSPRMLSYIEGHEVIATLNEILGSAGWSYRATVERAWDGMDERERFCVTFIGRCVLTVGDCVIEDVGAGHGVDRNPGIAIESAAKEAATDALKRCAKSLGYRMGLALYDKQQSHVGEEEPATGQPQPATPPPHGAKAKMLLAAITVAMDPKSREACTKSIKDAWASLTPSEKAAINKHADEKWQRQGHE